MGSTRSRRFGTPRCCVPLRGRYSPRFGSAGVVSATYDAGTLHASPGLGPELMFTMSELDECFGAQVQVGGDRGGGGRRPARIRIGRELRYRVSDVRRWQDRPHERPRSPRQPQERAVRESRCTSDAATGGGPSSNLHNRQVDVSRWSCRSIAHRYRVRINETSRCRRLEVRGGPILGFEARCGLLLTMGDRRHRRGGAA